jgi:hypothetical protein
VKLKYSEGSASAVFLFALFCFSSLSIGAGYIVVNAADTTNRFRAYNNARKETEILLRDIVDSLRSDPSPETNSCHDPVWSWNGKTMGDYTVSLRPLSDRLNPNFVRKNVFEKTALSALLRPGKSADDLQQFREDNGLSLAGSAYVDFFETDILNACFSNYGWANINLVDEFAARKLGEAVTGSLEKGERLRERIQLLLINKNQVDREELPRFLGEIYEELYPFINAEPLMNVNFIEPVLLKELLSYPDYRIVHPGRVYETVLRCRAAEAVNAADIHALLGIGEANPLLHYLGAVTWFWEIQIRGGGYCRGVVVCRQASGNLSVPDKYIIVEERFEKCPL